jgi:GT2 family glycosyltransferase
VRENISVIKLIERKDWEVLILPNNVEENPWSDVNVAIVPTGRVGPAEKRDFGAKLAKGHILVFLDDDSYPKTDILDVAEFYFDHKGADVLGGPAITPPNNSFWQRVSGAVFLSVYSGGSPERYISTGKVRNIDDWPSVNLMIKKDAFLDVGGFDCQYWPGEDTKLCLKLKNKHAVMLYIPDMIVWHHRRSGFFSHLKQVGAYGLHRGFFAKSHPETSLRLKYFIPTIFSFMTLLTFLTPLTPSWVIKVILVGWVFYAVALGFAIIDICKYERKLIAIMSILYVVPTHFYYGVRFFQGLFMRGPLISKLR